MTVGDRIKEIRTEKDIAQTDLAIRCGISKQTLYKYEMNIVTNIPLKTISKIAKELNVSEAILMGWEERESKEKATESAHLAGKIRRDKELSDALWKYFEMPEDKKKYVIDTINMLYQK